MENKSITIDIVTNGVDRYGRTIGTLYVNGVNIILLSVYEGFAWHYKKYSKDEELSNAEIHARKGEKGLWKNKGRWLQWNGGG